ncbi:MAG: AraC family transcriptional regulator [Opitutaceae bacterium]|nr:AraC family transcriptional regulator [Opitutaceae bacterium]
MTERFRALIDAMLRKGYPARVHFATGEVPAEETAGGVEGPRLSLCLAGTARYEVLRRSGGRSVVEVRRGEVIYALPRCLMEVHAESRYLSFGLVFNPGLTRFLVALKRRRPAPEGEAGAGGQGLSHRFLFTHHTPAALDADGRAFLAAMARCGQQEEGADARYVRRLLEIILLKGRTLLEERATIPEGGKAWFTWQAACQFVGEHLHEPLGREAVAEFLRLHPNHVSRLFTQFGGHSFHRHLLGERMARARRLLENPAANVAEVARACGFADAGYFVRCYRKFHDDG